MGWVRVGVEEADADGGDAQLPQPPGLVAGLALVEGGQHPTAKVEALGHLEDALQGDDGVGLHPEVGVAVAGGHALAGDLQHVAKAPRGQQRQGREALLKHRVGGDGGAVRDPARPSPVRGLQRPPQAVD